MAVTGIAVDYRGLRVCFEPSLLGYHHALIFFGCCTFLGLGNGIAMPNATAGLLSVRPHLAGTASGLGGAMMVGGGAALAQLAGTLLTQSRVLCLCNG